METRVAVTALALACVVGACSYNETAAYERDQNARIAEVRRRAAFDLDCASDALQIDALASSTMATERSPWDGHPLRTGALTEVAGVRGCGRRAAYVRASTGYGRGVEWILNASGSDAAPPVVSGASLLTSPDPPPRRGVR